MTDRELYEFVDVEEFLTELGIRNVRDTYSGEIQFSCPFPGHTHLDSTPSASMAQVERPIPSNPSETYPKTSFYCFTCGARGTAISFLADYEGVSVITAKRFLRERFARNYVSPQGSVAEALAKILEAKAPKTTERKERVLPESTLDQFYLNWPEVYAAWEATQGTGVHEAFGYMLNRGFEPETLMDFDIGYDPISKRITIPCRDEEGKLIGFKGRAWWEDAKPKYKVLGGEEYDFEPYQVSQVLWGLNEAAKSFSHSGGNMIIREGELNAMKLQEYGWNNSVGISGKRLSKAQVSLIKKYAARVIIWLDDPLDSAEAASKLDRSMPVWIVPHTDLDPVEMPRSSVEDAINSAQNSLQLRVV